jgi:hypothetical protein
MHVRPRFFDAAQNRWVRWDPATQTEEHELHDTLLGIIIPVLLSSGFRENAWRDPTAHGHNHICVSLLATSHP